MTEPNNNNNNNTNRNEASFRNNYAAALAQALREAEQSEPSLAQLCQETYVQLCTDDPQVSSRGCRALAQALIRNRPANINKDATYALSDRLLNGLAQMGQRVSRDGASSTRTKGNDNQTSEKSNKDEEDEEEATADQMNQQEPLVLTTPDDETSLQVAHASLAWAVYGRIPLLVCQSSELQQASTWIGSLRGPALPTSLENDNDNDTDKTTSHKEMEQDNSHIETEAKEEETTTLADDNDEQNSLAEVWATESDPSDYDFESGYDPQQQLQELDAWAQSVQIDPQQLSQSPLDTTWMDLAQTVTFLLQQLSLFRLSGLSVAEWQRQRVAEYLTQLTLILLLPSQSVLLSKMVDDSPNDDPPQTIPVMCSESHWQQLALQPLHVFRDAVVLPTHTQALLGDYLDLLQHLIQMDHQLKKSTGSRVAQQQDKIAPAMWMGVGALSTVCSNLASHPKYVAPLRTMVLQLSDDLCAILEQSHDSDAASTMPWAFLPLFQILVAATPNSAHRPLSNAQAQTLLNSGLFRQWLWWWESQGPNAPTREAMELNLFHLCATSPTLLGKYAWRYPGFAGQVTHQPTPTDTKEAAKSNHAVLLLWNLVGIQLASQASASSSIQWKNKKETNGPRAPPTVVECKSQAWEQYSWLCKRVAHVIEQWKNQRVQPQDAGNNVASNDRVQALEQDLLLLEQFREFAQALSESSNLLPVFCFGMALHEDDGDGAPNEKRRMAVRQSTTAIQKALNSWIPTAHQVLAKLKSEDESDEGVQDGTSGTNASPLSPVDRMQRQRPKLEDDAVTRVRKSLKSLQSAIDSCTSYTSTNGSSGSKDSRMIFSSKAD